MVVFQWKGGEGSSGSGSFLPLVSVYTYATVDADTSRSQKCQQILLSWSPRWP